MWVNGMDSPVGYGLFFFLCFCVLCLDSSLDVMGFKVSLAGVRRGGGIFLDSGTVLK